VDRIFRHGEAASEGDDCGPCWKVTSSAGRVLLFRAPSHEARVEWIEQLRHAAGHSGARKTSMDGKAALALARRLSRSSSSASATSVSPTAILQSPHGHQSRRRRRTDEEEAETSETLRDVLSTVEKQRREIEELQKRLATFQAGGEQPGEDREQNGLLQRAGRERARGLQARVERDREAKHVKEPVAVLEGTEGCAVEEGDVDLDAMLDDAAIEMCKSSRISAISDVLSEDDDTPGTEDDEDDHSESVHDRSPRKSRRERGSGGENLKNLRLVDESVERCASRDNEHDDEADESEAEGAEADQVEADAEILAASSSGLPASTKLESAVSPTTAPVCETASFTMAPTEEPELSDSPASPLSATSMNSYDAVDSESIQQQAAELAEMARNLNKDDLTDSSSTRESSDDGSLTSSFKGSHYSAGIFDSSASADNDFLQQQAMEIAEIARNLQSSFRVDPTSAKVSHCSVLQGLPRTQITIVCSVRCGIQAPLKTTSSGSSLLGSQSSFSGAHSRLFSVLLK